MFSLMLLLMRELSNILLLVILLLRMMMMTGGCDFHDGRFHHERRDGVLLVLVRAGTYEHARRALLGKLVLLLPDFLEKGHDIRRALAQALRGFFARFLIAHLIPHNNARVFATWLWL